MIPFICYFVLSLGDSLSETCDHIENNSGVYMCSHLKQHRCLYVLTLITQDILYNAHI